MSHVIGHGRYARETYPTTGQGNGPGGAIVPLTRTKFIDAGATGAENGAAVTTPYHSIVNFLAAIGTPSSTVDADTPMYGFISPGDYSVGALAIPARRNIILRGQGLVAAASAPIGAVTWANVDGPNPPSLSALLTIDSLVVPSITITDTPGGVVESGLFLLATDGISQVGPIDASGASRFMSLFIDGAIPFTGSINAPTANIDAIGAEFTGIGSVITCTTFGSNGTGVNACLFQQPLTIHASFGGFFTNCFFSAAVTLAGNSTFTFDGPSYAAWIAAGGVLSGTTVAVVVGGYSGASVEGAVLTDAGPTTVSLDGNGATAGYTKGGSHYTLPAATPLTGDRVVVLDTHGAKPGYTLKITRQGLGAFTLTVNNGGAGGSGTGNFQVVMPASKASSCLFQFDGTDWQVVDYGNQ